ncbi:MAG: S1-like domain-containing RNA-binding protein [Tannerellaceae bacterium]|nr:S1-like domain-containing RNA-binding protein [Tannerellaceae bacterium]
MVQIGNLNQLVVGKEVDFGVYLAGEDGKEILLPTRYVPEGTKVGDNIEVFIYHDNEGRLIATTVRPTALVNEFKFMQVKEVTNTGAFLEWGIMKDLLVPFSEQKAKMRVGEWYLVYVHLDHLTQRIVASAKFEKYLDNTIPAYEVNEKVDLLFYEETNLGYRVIINNSHRGLVYHSEVYQRIEIGSTMPGYIKQVREDEKIDVSLTPLGYSKVEDIAQTILNTLEIQNGFIDIHDKTDPKIIYSIFRCSKKSFKQAIGLLYKQRLIQMEPTGIRLLKK